MTEDWHPKATEISPPIGGQDPMAQILGLMSDLVVTANAQGDVTWVNAAFERQSGYSLAEAKGQPFASLAHSPDIFARMTAAVGGNGEAFYTARNGIPYSVAFNLKPLLAADGQTLGYVIMHRVVTEQRALEAALRSERYFLTRMMDTGVSAVAAFDAVGRCVFANSEARDILDRLTRAERLSADLWPLTRIAPDATDDDEDTISTGETVDDLPDELPFARVMRTGSPVHGMTVALALPNAPRRIFSANAAPLRDDETAARVVLSLTDITARFEADAARRAAAAQARFDARHDALTGQPNSRYFNSALVSANGPITVFVVNIDNYRSIRTVLGKAVGDALLCAFGKRLEQILGNQGLLARGEGSAFTLRLDEATPDAASTLARALHKALQPAFLLEDITVYATASIGLSHQTIEQTGAANTLLREAEVANFAATSAGGNRQAVYDPEMDARLSRHNAIIQALRHALQKGQFELAFQPKFGLPAGPLNAAHARYLVGAEALLRWNAPDLGRVSPDEFIPIAEAAGVISEIDFHVMGIFAQQLGKWRAAWHDIPASINLSPRSFEDDTLAPRLLDLLATEGVAPDGVTVEITETALISMSPAALSNIEILRRAGITLSIDDFGTGYSSFSYLQKLIVSEIKIDKSFIHLLPANEGDQAANDPTGTRAIVRTILTLARALGIRAVAEGVENTGQLAWLQAEGCQVVQGYLGGRAVSPETFERTYLRLSDVAHPPLRAGGA